jgi:hypothetical protein
MLVACRAVLLSRCGGYFAQQEALSCQRQFTDQVGVAVCEQNAQQARFAQSAALMSMSNTLMMQP